MWACLHQASQHPSRSGILQERETLTCRDVESMPGSLAGRWKVTLPSLGFLSTKPESLPPYQDPQYNWTISLLWLSVCWFPVCSFPTQLGLVPGTSAGVLGTRFCFPRPSSFA